MSSSSGRRGEPPNKGHTLRIMNPEARPQRDRGQGQAPAYVDRDPAIVDHYADATPPDQVGTGGIEIQICREEAGHESRPRWRTIEVWTKNRVYGVDASFVCFEVLERETGRLDPSHAMLGAKLVGGRKR